MDYSDRKTETELISLERKLKSLYKHSWDDMQVEAENYFAEFNERYDREYKKYKAGEYTEAQFKAWYQSQVARGKTWEAKRDTLAWMMVHANEKACDYINGTTPSIFTLNANYLAYMTEQKYDVAFALVDEGTIKNLVMEQSNNIEFRVNSINPKRDYKWNSKQIQNALVAGIMQGKSINDIASSFMVVQERNKNAAIRNARTSVTSAQNAGRIDTMRRSKEMGINVQKQWLSAHDGRVRDSHANLNGQIREIDDTFDNGLMYPADADGIPAEVYNCRCTLKYIYPKYQNIKSTENYRDTKQGNETYQEWLKRKKSKPDILTEYSNYSEYSMKMRYEDTARVDGIVDSLPSKARIILADTKFVLNADKTQAIPSRNTIKLFAGAPEEDIYHEIGHIIETKINTKDLIEYKNYLTEGLDVSDIITRTYYYADGTPKDIYLIRGKRFETEYQSRLYVDYLYQAINDDGSIRIDKMDECVSIPFAKYMMGYPISDKAKALIEGAIL